MDVEAAGTDVDDPSTGTHEPEVGGVVRGIWHGEADRTAVVATYEAPAGED